MEDFLFKFDLGCCLCNRFNGSDVVISYFTCNYRVSNVI